MGKKNKQTNKRISHRAGVAAAAAGAVVPGASLAVTAPGLPAVEASFRLGVAGLAAPSPARTVYSVLPPLCLGGKT